MNNLFFNSYAKMDALNTELIAAKQEAQDAAEYIKMLEERNLELRRKDSLHTKQERRLRGCYEGALTKLRHTRNDLKEANERIEYLENQARTKKCSLDSLVEEKVADALEDALRNIRRKERVHGY